MIPSNLKINIHVSLEGNDGRTMTWSKWFENFDDASEFVKTSKEEVDKVMDDENPHLKKLPF